MPSQIFTPVSVSPQRKGLQVVTSTELLASLAAASSTATSYSGTANTVITTDLPLYAIREHDYTVPAPPPPSPVSFRNDHHWLPQSMVNQNTNPLLRH